MALKLAGKNPAKFEFGDEVSQTVVTIQPDDEPDVVRAKLQRVLELEGGMQVPFVPLAAPLAPGAPVFTPADRAALEADLAKAQPMGWETTDTETLPEYG